MNNKPNGGKWGQKKEWGAKIFKKNNEIEMSDEAKSSDSNGWKKPASRRDNGGFIENKSFGESTHGNSEEEDKAALYDIIYNMVDRILEEKNTSFEGPSKKIKLEDERK